MTVSFETALFVNKGFIFFEELLKTSFRDSSNKIKLHHLKELICSLISYAEKSSLILERKEIREDSIDPCSFDKFSYRFF
jgi:hypothetical protein